MNQMLILLELVCVKLQEVEEKISWGPFAFVHSPFITVPIHSLKISYERYARFSSYLFFVSKDVELDNLFLLRLFKDSLQINHHSHVQHERKK